MSSRHLWNCQPLLLLLITSAHHFLLIRTICYSRFVPRRRHFSKTFLLFSPVDCLLFRGFIIVLAAKIPSYDTRSGDFTMEIREEIPERMFVYRGTQNGREGRRKNMIHPGNREGEKRLRRIIRLKGVETKKKNGEKRCGEVHSVVLNVLISFVFPEIWN